MRELEIKLQFERSGAAGIVAAFRSRGYVPGPPITQVDHVFAVDRSAVVSPARGTVIARVRIQGGRAFLTVKVRRSADLDRMEYETEVNDGKAAQDILSALGLVEVVQIKKERWAVHIDETTTICIDEVAQLGTFVEIELLEREIHDRESQLENRIAWVADIVSDTYAIVEQGYDRLMMSRPD